jgi:hypothetical protein
MATVFTIAGCVAMVVVPWPVHLLVVVWIAWSAYEARMGWRARRELRREKR